MPSPYRDLAGGASGKPLSAPQRAMAPAPEVRSDRSAAAGVTVDAAEIDRFEAMAERWWDDNGPMKPLHAMNPVRLGFIRAQVIAHFQRGGDDPLPLNGLRVADVGCGGGILSEPLARMGGDVTGFDPATANIHIARQHAAAMGLSINYRAEPIEVAAANHERFDLITALEVIEHVAEVDAFLDALSKVLAPGGLIILSTLNRTKRSFAGAIVGAEWLLRWLPVGTHDWRKFVTPAELEAALARAGLALLDSRGMVPAPLTGGWRLGADMAVNYIVAATARTR